MLLKIKEEQVSLFDLLDGANVVDKSIKIGTEEDIRLKTDDVDSSSKSIVNIAPDFLEDIDEDLNVNLNLNLKEAELNIIPNELNSLHFKLADFISKIDLPYINNHFVSQLNETQLSIINKYLNGCNRIVKKTTGAILVEMDNSTLYYNNAGVLEFTIPTSTALLPSDVILVVNKDKDINEQQLSVLNSLGVSRCIKRIGDCNIIVAGDTTKVINPNGWILDYSQNTCYNSEIEIYCIADLKEQLNITVNSDNNTSSKQDKYNNEDNINVANYSFEIGDTVESIYNGIPIVGVVKRIYNNGLTINIEWDKKQSAFYLYNVKKI